MIEQISFQVSPAVSNEALNRLFSSAWPNHQPHDIAARLAHSLVWICAFHQSELVGFINVAWDGGIHGFILDTTTHRDFQGQGIGQELVKIAILEAKTRGLEWLHVDYEPHLDRFYKEAGFVSTAAGLIDLSQDPQHS